VKANDKKTYQLTDKGYDVLSLEFPFCRFLRSSWDGRWRILSYEIPEKKREIRDKLRREVSGWGLGPWHRSFWLTPHPVIPFLKKIISSEEKMYIQAFESTYAFGDQEILIEKVWEKTQLEKKYRRLFMKWHDILSKEEEKIKKMKMIISEYVELLKIDPGLPKELVGEKWIGFEAINLFKEIRTILLTKKQS
jgi:phenylacetic acid degradation operon negative regulatory protein